MEEEESILTLQAKQEEVEDSHGAIISDNHDNYYPRYTNDEAKEGKQQQQQPEGDKLLKKNKQNKNRHVVEGFTAEEEDDDNSNKCQRFNSLLNWTPSPCLTELVLWISVPLMAWIVGFLLVGSPALPRGFLFSLILLEVSGLVAGFLMQKLNLPPLLGMLIVGILLRNCRELDEIIDISPDLSSVLRQIALVIILIRAGLGLDPEALMKLKGVVIRLAFLPCLTEAIVIAISSRFILGFPWVWGFLLGFVLAAVSPAVVVPCLLSLKDRGYGVDKGIPTIVIAASSVDDILAISFFGVTLGFALSEGSLIKSLVQGPIELVIGIGFGTTLGLFMGILFSAHEKVWTYATIIRTIFPLAVGIVAVFGSQFVEYPGAGALACLTAAFVAAMVWRKKGVLADDDTLSWNFSFLWYLFQPLLFGLIGREIDLFSLDSRIVGLGLLCVFVALIVRLIVSYLAVSGAGLNVKEKLFVAVSWIPKATVQAAIGPVALDTARKLGSGSEAEKLGLEVLTIAVLVILITAPIGSIAVTILGQRLLTMSNKAK